MDDIDGLTGLKNGEALHRDAKAWFSRPDWSYLRINLDRFKLFNEVYGHEAGDAHLVAAAKMLQTAMPDAEIYRLHGDDFVCLTEKSLGCATILAQQIVAEARAMKVNVAHREADGCSVCVVVTHVPTHATNSSELNGISGPAMIAAKFRGCSQIVVAQNKNAR